MFALKELGIEDVDSFWNFLNVLDIETDCMMYEPNEREQRTNIQELRSDIQINVVEGNDFLQIAVEDHKIVGYIRAERGRFNRLSHTAYIVAGILKDYRKKGIGTALFENLDKWAKENGILRLELTVECRNEAAKHLYEKSGFEVEGIRRKAMHIGKDFVDEYYMAKMLYSGSHTGKNGKTNIRRD